MPATSAGITITSARRRFAPVEVDGLLLIEPRGRGGVSVRGRFLHRVQAVVEGNCKDDQGENRSNKHAHGNLHWAPTNRHRESAIAVSAWLTRRQTRNGPK